MNGAMLVVYFIGHIGAGIILYVGNSYGTLSFWDIIVVIVLIDNTEAVPGIEKEDR